jgi:hypothetical protein
MSKPPPRLTGRPSTHDRGKSTWQWEVQTEVDTAGVRSLAEGLSIDEPLPKTVDLTPYNQPISQGKERAKGRTLDDMRRLSEGIKRKRENIHRELAQVNVDKMK